jgi:hypothetical protein
MKSIQTYNNFIKEAIGYDRHDFFFKFYFRNIFFNKFSKYAENGFISENFKRDHYNLCSIFEEKSEGALNHITKTFSLEPVQHIYLWYYLENIVPNYLGITGRHTFISQEDAMIFENIPIDYIYSLFDNMIDFSTIAKIEEYFLSELDLEHTIVLEFLENNDFLQYASENFKNKIQHLLDAKKFDLL